MKIRYKIKYDDEMMTAIYSVEDLENRDLIESMYFLHNNKLDIIRRDYSTGVFDDMGQEVFENDEVATIDGETGTVELKPGGFYLRDMPLGELEIHQIVRSG